MKESVSIPVIGNGDIVDEESALKMFEYTGVDGIMIGRGAMGKPWIFSQIEHYLKTGEKQQVPQLEERLDIIKKHINLAVQEKGENIAIKEMRKHLACYVRNLKNASKLREEINRIETQEELLKTLDLFFEKE